MKNVTALVLGVLGIAGPAFADDNTLENAVGGGVGGAGGAVVADKLGEDDDHYARHDHDHDDHDDHDHDDDDDD